MKKGNSTALLLEEIKDLLDKTRSVRQTFIDTPLESTDAEYAKTWYIFNACVAYNCLAAVGTYLSKLHEQSFAWPDIDSITGWPVFEEDLYHAHSDLVQSFNVTTLAYADAIEMDRVLEVLWAPLANHFSLLELNLNQIKTAVE